MYVYLRALYDPEHTLMMIVVYSVRVGTTLYS